MGKCLFIGGSADGKIINVVPDGLPRYRYPTPQPFRYCPMETNAHIAQVIPTEMYFPHAYHIDGASFLIYAAEGMTPIEVFTKLIKGYANKQEVTNG